MVSMILSSLKSVQLICLGGSSLVLIEDLSFTDRPTSIPSSTWETKKENSAGRTEASPVLYLFLCVLSFSSLMRKVAESQKKRNEMN